MGRSLWHTREMNKDQLFLRAQRSHQEGSLAQAERDYEQLLLRDANHAGALHYLGLLRLDQGEVSAGLHLLEQSLRLQPGSIDFAQNVAMALRDHGEPERALDYYNQLLSHLPESAELLHQRAVLYFQQGEIDRARWGWEQALRFSPEVSNYWLSLGRCYRAYQDVSSYHQAQKCLQKSIDIEPHSALAWNLLANTFTELGKPEPAIRAYQKALDNLPNEHPLSLSVQTNLAVAYLESHRPKLAFKQLLKISTKHPDFSPAQYNLGLLEMQYGNFASGFKRYEVSRWADNAQIRPQGNLSRPVWQGQKVKSLLVCHERGYGDSLQFVRFLYELSAYTQILYLEVPAALAPLMQRLFLPLQCSLEILVEGESLPETEAWLPMLSLGSFFASALDQVSQLKRLPYFQVPVAERFSSRPSVGVVWSTGKRSAPQLHTLYRRRSVDPKAFTALAQVFPALSFYSFQVGEDEALPEAVRPLPVPLTDFYDTARYLQTMDLVITVDTAVAHLAGALDLPTWVLIPSVADWRWGFEENHSHWYSQKMRIFRQKPEDLAWSEVFTKLRLALGAFQNA